MEFNTLNNIKPLNISSIDYTKDNKPNNLISGSLSAMIEPYFALAFELGFGIGSSYDISLNFDAIVGIKIESTIKSSLFTVKSKKTGVTKKYLMKLEYGPHLYFKLGAKVGPFDFDITEIPVIEDKFNRINYYLERTNIETKEFRFGISSEKTYTQLQLLAFQNEIGRLAKLFNNKYNPFNVLIEKNKGDSGKYTVVLMDENANNELVTKTKKCILGKNCQVTLDTNEFKFIPINKQTTKRETETILDCSLPYYVYQLEYHVIYQVFMIIINVIHVKEVKYIIHF